MQKHFVNVNRHLIAANVKDGGCRPIYSIRSTRCGRAVYAHSVIMHGKVTLIDPRAAKPLACGARVWLEVEGDIVLVDPTPFDEISFGTKA